MKKALISAALALPLVTGLSGCVVAVHDGEWDSESSWSQDWEDRQESNRRAISSLQVGTSIDSVRHELGTPDFTEVYNDNGEKVHVLFYRTQRTKGDGMTTKEECTALIFKQDKLDSWGERAYRSL